MPKEITWSDPEDIGILLSEAHPDIDPWLFALPTCTSM